MAWIVPVAQAAASYFSADKANKAAKKGSSTTQNSLSTPWGPSEPYRMAGMRGAYDLLNGGYQMQPSNPAFQNYNWRNNPTGVLDPRALSGGGGAPAGPPASGGRGGGSGGGQKVPKRNYTEELLGGISDRARAGHPLYNTSTNFSNTMMTGGEMNPYRTTAASAFSNLQNDPTLAGWMQYLGGVDLNSLGGGMGGGGSYGGGGGGVGSGPIGIENYIRNILNGQYLDQANPHRDAMIAGVERDVSNAFNRNVLPGINANFTGAGAFGGSMYERALAQSAGEYTNELADAIGNIRFGEYENRMGQIDNALGLGTQYDLGVIDAQSRAAAAASSAGASMYGADRDANTRMALARLAAMGDAVGLSTGLRQAGAEGLGSLAALYSSDMMGTLGMVPDLTGLDIRDYSAALNASLGRDEIRGRNSASRASANAQQAALDWQREQYYREAPFTDLMRYTDIINAMSGGYGTNVQSGTASGGQSINPWAQALQGGLAGWYTYNQSRSPYSGGSGQANRTPSGFETGQAATNIYGSF